MQYAIAAAHFLPKHAAAAAWKYRSLSHVEQVGLPPTPKDRGAEQGDVDGASECSLALGMVAAETRTRVAAQQAAGFTEQAALGAGQSGMGFQEELGTVAGPAHLGALIGSQTAHPGDDPRWSRSRSNPW